MNAYKESVDKLLREAAQTLLTPSTTPEPNDKDAQILQLREALRKCLDTFCCPDEHQPWNPCAPCDALAAAKDALALPAPAVIPLTDVKPLIDAAKTLKAAKGRHNTGIAYERFLEAVEAFTTKHPQPTNISKLLEHHNL